MSLTDRLPVLQPGHRRLFLLRHGETEWNALGKMQGGGFDIPLNDNGIKQARLAAAELPPTLLGVIASSHLSRAVQTADVIHGKYPLAARFVSPDFGEMRFGTFEGHTRRGPEAKPELIAEFEKQNQKMYDDVTLRWPGETAESISFVEKRVPRGLQRLWEDFDHDHVAIVGHGRLNKVLLTSVLLGDVSRNEKTLNQGNTCINALDWNPAENKYTALVLNHIEHTRRGEA